MNACQSLCMPILMNANLRAAVMDQIMDNNQHIWNRKDWVNKTQALVKEFRNLHPGALTWKLG